MQTCPPALLQFPDNPFKSAALEFDWLCGSQAYRATLFSQVSDWKEDACQIQFAGVLLGTFSFGAVADIVGRKPIAILTLVLGITANYATGSAVAGQQRGNAGLAPTWQVLLAVRFFLGLAVGGTLVVSCTFVMEMLLPQQRMALRAFFNWVSGSFR